jgi:hypothetical protein
MRMDHDKPEFPGVSLAGIVLLDRRVLGGECQQRQADGDKE